MHFILYFVVVAAAIDKIETVRKHSYYRSDEQREGKKIHYRMSKKM